MIAKIPYYKAALLFAMLFTSLSAYCQLPDFTLTVTPTAATCPGNGSLALSVSGINPAASMEYVVYLLPNETEAVVVVNAGPVLNRPAGTYKIVATQSLAPNAPVTKTAIVTIADTFVPLNYSSDIVNLRCGNDGRITVNNLSGTIVSYSLVAPSPVIVGPQASNVFSGLPAGQYRIKIVTSCNQEVFFDRQIISVGTAMVINPVVFDDDILPSCSTIQVTHSYNAVAGNEIVYPLTFVFTVNPPGGGAPVVITQTVQNGTNAGEVVATIPFYYDVQYTYSLVATNACGTPTTRPTNVVYKRMTATATPDIENCGDNSFTLKPQFFRAPYTVSFTSAPATFNPTNYYPQQVFVTDEVVYGGANNTVPEGNYTAVITDACGRSATVTFVIQDPIIDPVVAGEVIGCSPTGTIRISINGGRTLTMVRVMQAPVGYPSALPHNISSSIVTDGLIRSNMPIGAYVFEITDDCGGVYLEPFTLAPSGGPAGELTIQQRAGCDLGEGSVRLTIPTGSNFTMVRITQAPPDFPHPLPYIATGLATGNNTYLNGLPDGQYTFETIDNCGTPRNKTLMVEGYTESANAFSVVARCGSFDLDLHHTSNGNYVSSYWLQKLNTANNTWGHPGTGAAYPLNSLPNGTNSVALINGQVNIFQPYTGQFRILKAFYTYGNGSATNNRCVVQVGEVFNYDGLPKITNVYAFPCAGGLTEVGVEAYGAAPLQYKIISKNGNTAFTVNNGASPLFQGLEPATYVFTVTDNCGNTFPYPATINELDPLEITATGFCEGENSVLSVQQFTFLNYAWYEQSAPSVILSTGSTLEFPAFSSANDAGTYLVTITSSTANSCLNQTLPPYVINANNLPNAGADKTSSVCHYGNAVDLAQYLSTPHDTGGNWVAVTNGVQLTGSQFTTAGLQAGAYQFKYTVSGVCSLVDEATITINLTDRPQTPVPNPVTPICGTGTLNLSIPAVAGATYSWTGPNNFTSSLQSPVINNADSAAAGIYEVMVTIGTCTSFAGQVAVQITPLPVYHLESTVSELCTGQSATITMVPDTAGTLVIQGWYQDGVLLPGVLTQSITALEPGLYEVEAGNGACTGSRQGFTINAGTLSGAVVLEAECDNSDQYVVYVVNEADFAGATFTWSGPDGFTATGARAIITGLSTGDYTVTINNGGCEKAEPVTVLNTFCKIPKGISPNGDGSNDSFDLSNFDINELSIFNRYGLKVYSQANYKNEWHGQSNKGTLPSGTYYYMLKLTDGRDMTGWVYLQRD